MDKNSKKNLIYITAFLAVIAGTGLFSMAHPQEDYSEFENRRLTRLPAISAKGIASGTFQDQMEDGLKDQSLLKTASVKLSALTDLVSGRFDKNETYFTYHGDYVKKETDNDYTDSRLSLNSQIIEKFAEQTGVTIDLCLIPPKGSARASELPSFAPYLDDEALRKKVAFAAPALNLVPMERLLSSDQQTYFRSDHHYNSLGAYLAASDYLAFLGEEADPIEEYGLKEQSGKFYGTLYRKAPLFDSSYDTISIPVKVPALTVSYSYGGDGRLSMAKTSDSLYESAYLGTADKYSIYMGGNHGLAVVENREADEDGPTLLMIKDSFANSALPYLLKDFKRIVLVDLRYYSGSVKDLVTEYGPERVVVWYESLDYAKESRFPALIR